MMGCLWGRGPPRWRADPPPPAPPPGGAPLGGRVGPPAGPTGLCGFVELVADAVVGLRRDGLVVRALVLAGGGLGLVVGGVGALDGLLEPRERRGDVRAGELGERLGG